MINEADLENYLAQSNEEDFKETYNFIKIAAKKIWKEPRLGWYTDHGPKHSERIIFHLNRLCAGLLSNPDKECQDYRLTVDEVFLLLSAAWLHDIGMQDLTNSRTHSVDSMDNEDWEEVRKEHPKKVYDMIMNPSTGERSNKFWIGIKPDSKFRAPLALICKGHGSSYFSDTVSEFKIILSILEGKGKK